MKKSLSTLILVFTLVSCMSEEKLDLDTSGDLSIRTIGISKEKSFLGEEDAEVDYPLVRTNMVNIKRGIAIVDPFNP